MGKARILKSVYLLYAHCMHMQTSELRLSPSSGEATVFSDNLPGYPDNIRQATDGNVWVPIAATRSEGDNWLAARPSLRSLMTKVHKLATGFLSPDNDSCFAATFAPSSSCGRRMDDEKIWSGSEVGFRDGQSGGVPA
ncbi:hypothetical protein COOONC_03460 [Cooperia oncophora]